MRPSESFIRSSLPYTLQGSLLDVEGKQREIPEFDKNSVRQSKQVFLLEKTEQVSGIATC